MTQDEIIRMAQEFGTQVQHEWNMGGLDDGLYMDFATQVALRVAAVVAAHERETCAKVCEAKQRYNAMHANTEFAAAIRAINFEEDTGFRPVSEMIAEHKKDPKKKAAIERAEARKAEVAPDGRVAKTVFTLEDISAASDAGYKAAMVDAQAEHGEKQMTQDEIIRMAREIGAMQHELKHFAALVAAAERDKQSENFAKAIAKLVKCCRALAEENEAAILAEREACAKVCDARTGEPGWCCADAIRVRGETK